MKNREFYKDKIMNWNEETDGNFCENFVMHIILKTETCKGMSCSHCAMKRDLWLEEEYEEPGVDWSKVEVDTPILVSSDGEKWEKGYFAAYDDRIVCTYPMGATSWSSKGGYTLWNYAKLAEVNE